MDTLLRGIIKFFAGIYFSLFYKKQHGVYIPASGKVLEKSELNNMLDATLDMWLTTGRFNERFERRLAEYLGVKYALTVNSGSSANLLALTALMSHKLGDKRLRKGDEVITVAAGFPTTVAPIVQNGLVPVFIDVKVESCNINADLIEAALSDKTKAVFIAHTLGNPFDLDVVAAICKKHGLWLIEDSCDALGAKYQGRFTGTIGHIGTFSFYPAHHITMGEGGAVVTNDALLNKVLMSIRDWGRDCWCPPGKDNSCKNRFNLQYGNLPAGYDHKYVYSHLGYNLKITDWQAACGLAQLDKLERFIQKRRDNFSMLYKALEELEDFNRYFIVPQALQQAEPSWFGFIIAVKDNPKFNKIELCRFLEEHNIGTRQLFAGNMLRQPVFVDEDILLRIGSGELLSSRQVGAKHYALLPETDKVMNQVFWIGVWPGITGRDIEYIAQIFKEFLQNKK